ncbi:MAG: hypothetical protein EP317_05105 [Bacillota bacterium]|nr:MAG: hypothetical protein EP317_05105 [Bacillota bacterium]
MQILGIILLIYGAFLLVGFIMQFPFFYQNAKSKVLIKMMGKTGYNILLIILGGIALTFGIIILT